MRGSVPDRVHAAAALLDLADKLAGDDVHDAFDLPWPLADCLVGGAWAQAAAARIGAVAGIDNPLVFARRIKELFPNGARRIALERIVEQDGRGRAGRGMEILANPARGKERKKSTHPRDGAPFIFTPRKAAPFHFPAAFAPERPDRFTGAALSPFRLRPGEIDRIAAIIGRTLPWFAPGGRAPFLVERFSRGEDGPVADGFAIHQGEAILSGMTGQGKSQMATIIAHACVAKSMGVALVLPDTRTLGGDVYRALCAVFGARNVRFVTGSGSAQASRERLTDIGPDAILSCKLGALLPDWRERARFDDVMRAEDRLPCRLEGAITARKGDCEGAEHGSGNGGGNVPCLCPFLGRGCELRSDMEALDAPLLVTNVHALRASRAGDGSLWEAVMRRPVQIYDEFDNLSLQLGNLASVTFALVNETRGEAQHGALVAIERLRATLGRNSASLLPREQADAFLKVFNALNIMARTGLAHDRLDGRRPGGRFKPWRALTVAAGGGDEDAEIDSAFWGNVLAHWRDFANVVFRGQPPAEQPYARTWDVICGYHDSEHPGRAADALAADMARAFGHLPGYAEAMGRADTGKLVGAFILTLCDPIMRYLPMVLVQIAEDDRKALKSASRDREDGGHVPMSHGAMVDSPVPITGADCVFTLGVDGEGRGRVSAEVLTNLAGVALRLPTAGAMKIFCSATPGHDLNPHLAAPPTARHRYLVSRQVQPEVPCGAPAGMWLSHLPDLSRHTMTGMDPRKREMVLAATLVRRFGRHGVMERLVSLYGNRDIHLVVRSWTSAEFCARVLQGLGVSVLVLDPADDRPFDRQIVDFHMSNRDEGLRVICSPLATIGRGLSIMRPDGDFLVPAIGITYFPLAFNSAPGEDYGQVDGVTEATMADIQRMLRGEAPDLGELRAMRRRAESLRWIAETQGDAMRGDSILRRSFADAFLADLLQAAGRGLRAGYPGITLMDDLTFHHTRHRTPGLVPLIREIVMDRAAGDPFQERVLAPVLRSFREPLPDVLANTIGVEPFDFIDMSRKDRP